MSWIVIQALASQIWVTWLTLVFLGIAFYAFRPKNRKRFDDASKIPFTSDSDD